MEQYQHLRNSIALGVRNFSISLNLFLNKKLSKKKKKKKYHSFTKTVASEMNLKQGNDLLR